MDKVLWIPMPIVTYSWLLNRLQTLPLDVSTAPMSLFSDWNVYNILYDDHTFYGHRISQIRVGVTGNLDNPDAEVRCMPQ